MKTDYKILDSGQALLELIIVVPLFIGFIFSLLLFYSKIIKEETNTHVKRSLGLCQSSYSQEERQVAGWSLYEGSREILEYKGFLVFNPSTLFQSSFKEDGVFSDKKHIKKSSSQFCSQDGVFFVESDIFDTENSKGLHVCTDKQDYERFQGLVAKNSKLNLEYLHQEPTFSLHDGFTFTMRKNSAAYVSRFLAIPLNTKSEIQKYAEECLFSPMSEYNECHREKTVQAIFQNISVDGANLQLSLCFGEATRSCISSASTKGTLASAVFAACMLEKLALIVESYFTAKESEACPFVNDKVHFFRNSIDELIRFKEYAIASEEKAQTVILFVNTFKTY